MKATEKSALALHIEEKLVSFHHYISPLPGIKLHADLAQFVVLITEYSIQVEKIISSAQQPVERNLVDPKNARFDPVMAAIWYHQHGDLDEACWLMFLSCYFGKHPTQKWKLLTSIYTGLGNENLWTWAHVCLDSQGFQNWLLAYQAVLVAKGNFGQNHKYSKMHSNKARSCAEELLSYIRWVQSFSGHKLLFELATDEAQGQENAVFNYLYGSMNEFTGIRKQVKVDYLNLIGNAGIATIKPEQLYLNDLLMVKKGARYLLGGNSKSKVPLAEHNLLMIQLASHLKIPNAIQVLQLAVRKFATDKFALQMQNFRRYDTT